MLSGLFYTGPFNLESHPSRKHVSYILSSRITPKLKFQMKVGTKECKEGGTNWEGIILSTFKRCLMAVFLHGALSWYDDLGDVCSKISQCNTCIDKICLLYIWLYDVVVFLFVYIGFCIVGISVLPSS